MSMFQIVNFVVRTRIFFQAIQLGGASALNGAILRNRAFVSKGAVGWKGDFFYGRELSIGH